MTDNRHIADYDGALYSPDELLWKHAVSFCHQHNLVEPEKAGGENKFGIKITLPTGDTFSTLLGDDWERVHWYGTEQERDAAYDKMAQRHGYYRTTDTPTQVLIKIVR